MSSGPTDRLHGEIQQLCLYSFACVGGPPLAFDARLTRLGPGLDVTLGAGTFANGEGHPGQERALLEITRCPTAAERRRSGRVYASRLAALERRAR